MARSTTPKGDLSLHAALNRAYMAGRITFFTDRHVLARPGSPVYNALDVFVPPLVLMVSSLTLLFAFGLLEWIIALVAVLLFQAFLAPHFVHWRLHRRSIDAVLKHPHNLNLLWETGGLAIALKEWPEKNCVGPHGDWRNFAKNYLEDPDDRAS